MNQALEWTSFVNYKDKLFTWEKTLHLDVGSVNRPWNTLSVEYHNEEGVSFKQAIYDCYINLSNIGTPMKKVCLTLNYTTFEDEPVDRYRKRSTSSHCYLVTEHMSKFNISGDITSMFRDLDTILINADTGYSQLGYITSLSVTAMNVEKFEKMNYVKPNKDNTIGPCTYSQDPTFIDYAWFDSNDCKSLAL